MKGACNSLLFAFLLSAGLAACDFRSQGEVIYQHSCNYCHMEDGNGLARLILPFEEHRFVEDRQILVCTVVKGLDQGDTGHFMPRFDKLDHAQLANVLNYIRGLKKMQAPPFTDLEVSRLREACH
ncbi:MAG TPA: cytochrome c [Saprospiraceae bacterium]|nr:cytochrome c [Saprospiraceae bacterium]HNT22396.1 cytochrome c [Saprospiraceae bacterium]